MWGSWRCGGEGLPLGSALPQGLGQNGVPDGGGGQSTGCGQTHPHRQTSDPGDSLPSEKQCVWISKAPGVPPSENTGNKKRSNRTCWGVRIAGSQLFRGVCASPGQCPLQSTQPRPLSALPPRERCPASLIRALGCERTQGASPAHSPVSAFCPSPSSTAGLPGPRVPTGLTGRQPAFASGMVLISLVTRAGGDVGSARSGVGGRVLSALCPGLALATTQHRRRSAAARPEQPCGLHAARSPP